MSLFDDDFGFDDAMLLGTGYALYRHGQDRQTEQLVNALQQAGAGATESMVRDIPDDEEQVREAPNALEYTTAMVPEDWDEDLIGQDPLKLQLQVAVNSALIRRARLPHILLASGYPGVGKTTVGRLLARSMGSQMIEVVPPFNIYTLVETAKRLRARDILFIDEIHKLTDGVGARGAEILLKVLEDHVAFLPNGEVVRLEDFTVAGATTDRDKLPETVVDRFKIKPYFQAYSQEELVRIAVKFAYRHRSEEYLDIDLAIAISEACRGTPRIAEEMILAVRDLNLTMGGTVTPNDLLQFLEVETDGLTRMHTHYLTAMRQYFARENKDGGVEFIAGESAMQGILRETKQGIGRVERFLVERGLIDRTPRGRRLTALGIIRAEDLIANGKGVADV